MKRQTLKQRRSLAAKKGWDSRRQKKLYAAWAAVAEKAKTAPVVPCPEQASVSLPGFDLMTYEQERLSALSNGPHPLPGTRAWMEQHGFTVTEIPETPTKPTLWQRLKAWWGT